MAGQLTIDTLKASSGALATYNGMNGIAKAWVVFAGSTGTIAASMNVSSITRASTGAYYINFTTAFPDTNYVMAGYAEWRTGTSSVAGITYGGDSLKTASSAYIITQQYNSGAAYDALTAGVVIYHL